MYHADKKLFGEALLESLSQKYREELMQFHEVAICSKEHKERIRALIDNSENSENRRRQQNWKWIAILVAAILLVGCTAYVYRKQIGKFVEEIFDDYINVSIDETKSGHGAIISEIYSLSYVPEGYVLKKTVAMSSYTVSEWINDSNEKIVLEQFNSQESNFGYDDDSSYIEIVLKNGETVYCRFNQGSSFCVWSKERYIMSLFCTNIISEDEISMMIKSLYCEEE